MEQGGGDIPTSTEGLKHLPRLDTLPGATPHPHPTPHPLTLSSAGVVQLWSLWQC